MILKKTVVLKQNWLIKDFDSPYSLDGGGMDFALEREASEENGWLSAVMPSVVQEVLFEKGLLPTDVLETGRAEDCKWVSEKDWAYSCEFDGPEVSGLAFLEFLGLDAVCDIYLNGSIIARHSDMFLPCRIEISGLLKDKNRLLLYFHRPGKVIKAFEEKIPKRYEGKIRAGALLRKPHGDFGSHGGVVPYFTPIGVFDDIRLISIDKCEISYEDIDIRFNEDISRAFINVRLECAGSVEGVLPEFKLLAPDSSEVFCVEGESSHWIKSEAGYEYLFQAEVENPILWWPRNYGDQPLYKFCAALIGQGGICDSQEKTIGFRKMEVVGDMKFRVNGKVIKIWGSCITPMWGVSHRWQRDRGFKVLDYAVKGNMNALRLWGPSQPYSNELYEQCNRLGILIWQEFHTWGAHMPDIPEYSAPVLEEAKRMIKRLKHHPCIFMWCGGNEQIYMCDLFDKEAKVRFGHDIIRYGLKDLAAKMDPCRYYHISSPNMGQYANEAVYGDNHGSRASLAFLPGEGHARFFSEDIRTSIPELKSLKRFIKPEDLWPEGYADVQPYGVKKPLPESWMARTINHMEEKAGPYELFYDAVDPKSLIYKINAAAAYDIRLTINRLRQGKPFYSSMSERFCSGYLIWKLETAWPQIYCALIDYYLEPGQPYYAVRRAYAPIHASIDLQDHVYVWGTNDTLHDFSGELKVEIYDIEAEKLTHERSFPVGIPAGDSLIFKNLDELGQFNRTSVIHAALIDASGVFVDEDFQYVKPERKLTFPEAKLKLEKAGERLLLISSDRFARSVELSGNDGGDAFGWHFEDNYFDLMPGQKKYIRILGRHSSGRASAKAFYSAHAATVELP
ncbi:MAG: hypothetical protein LBU32_01055 [Clostridiales bacterium]|jgi:hypothetical protein|nr:hypothetical protein [Clostridiales bacterium]